MTQAVTPEGTYTYIFDIRSNRTSMTFISTDTITNKTTNYLYSIDDRLLSYTVTDNTQTPPTVIKSAAYTHDNAGNLLTEAITESGATETTTYTYYADNRIKTVTLPSSEVVTYTYFASGARATKTTTSTHIKYHYTTGLWKEEHLDATDHNIVLKTVFYEGSRYTIDPGAVGGGDEEIYYLIRDKNGTTYKLVDENDNVVCEYGYDPFGERTTNTNPAIYNPIGVGGTYFDEETGLYFAQVRYYDAEVGRFTTKDGYLGTATSSISQNRYIYCHQNPSTFVDPSGFAPEDPEGADSAFEQTPDKKVEFNSDTEQLTKTNDPGNIIGPLKPIEVGENNAGTSTDGDTTTTWYSQETGKDHHGNETYRVTGTVTTTNEDGSTTTTNFTMDARGPAGGTFEGVASVDGTLVGITATASGACQMVGMTAMNNSTRSAFPDNYRKGTSFINHTAKGRGIQRALSKMGKAGQSFADDPMGALADIENFASENKNAFMAMNTSRYGREDLFYFGAMMGWAIASVILDSDTEGDKGLVAAVRKAVVNWNKNGFSDISSSKKIQIFNEWIDSPTSSLTVFDFFMTQGFWAAVNNEYLPFDHKKGKGYDASLNIIDVARMQSALWLITSIGGTYNGENLPDRATAITILSAVLGVIGLFTNPLLSWIGGAGGLATMIIDAIIPRTGDKIPQNGAGFSTFMYNEIRSNKLIRSTKSMWNWHVYQINSFFAGVGTASIYLSHKMNQNWAARTNSSSIFKKGDLLAAADIFLSYSMNVVGSKKKYYLTAGAAFSAFGGEPIAKSDFIDILDKWQFIDN